MCLIIVLPKQNQIRTAPIRGAVCVVQRKDQMTKVIRNKLGPIPDDYLENDPIYPPPLSKEWLPKPEPFTDDHGTDPKYQPGDIIGPF
jgi:hypothetical protein